MSRFCVALAFAGLVVGCSSGKKTSDKIRIAVIPKGTTHEFWTSVRYGAEKAARELSKDGKEVEILWKGPLSEGDTKGQIDVVREFIGDQVDGICLAPLDADAMVKYVEEAKAAEIPVVIFDSGLSGDKNTHMAYVATNNLRGGKLAAKRLRAVMGGKGKVIMLRYKVDSESTEQRERGFLEAIKEFKGIDVVSSDQYAGVKKGEAKQKAISVLKDYMENNPKVKPEDIGVFAVCESNAEGVLLALKDLDLEGKVKFVAFDPSKTLIEAMSATPTKVHGIILQDPVTMGYLSVKVMVNKLRKKKLEDGVEADENIKLERSGEWLRVATGEYDATPANMEDARMKELLNPKQSK